MSALERPESQAERFANTASAAIGVLMALACLPALLGVVSRVSVYGAIGAWVFYGSVLLLYTSSTLYHALPPGDLRRKVRLLDHSAIFILIAGTYTPLTLGPLREHGGTWLLGLEWILAALGIAMKVSGSLRFGRMSNIIYLLVAWIGLLWAKPFVVGMAMPGIGWILAGGFFYSGGIVFYAAKHRPYAHFVWHLFVLGGTVCHAVAVFGYAVR
ncbi:hemolysin D [Spartobacteria bacterium LR76]|nr:hemolysin D [Spartobacteria bacterium LR76]